MSISKPVKTYIISFVFTFLFAAAGGIVTYVGMPKYEAANHPFLTPPSWLFPVVWSILFALMAIGAARVYLSDKKVTPRTAFIYVLQLTMNFWWCVLFFGFGLFGFSFFWLIALLAAVIIMAVLFYSADKLSGLLQIPYILWLGFAAYLNISIWLIN